MAPPSSRAITRILVALDESPRAPSVLAKAVEIARSVGASIRVFHAIAIPPEFPAAAATETGDPLPAHLRKAATHRLSALTAGIGDVPIDIVIEESHRASQAILEAASSYRADLIVLGSHGYDLVDRLLGTTAAKVVNTSTVDVLVVHRQS